MSVSAKITPTPESLSKQLIESQATLKIYDSMTTNKRSFEPLQVGKVGMYVCGMTVYDYCHIGHARVMVAFDVVSRWLRHLGFDVNYVRNITDIDDKIIARANENGEEIGQLTERFITAMHEDAAALGCESPDAEPRATQHIDDMLQMIGTLEQKEHAYAASNGDVYYAVDTFEGYGKLSKRKLEDLQAGSRVDVDTDKKNPFDFVLWKAAKAGEPQWDSNWGGGRPGWHIECSAMSTKCLGNSFDIHGGGHDLQFPHHENEIAQSEAATGCTYANNWMHVGFINVDGEKMSKSLGNFFTIREVMEKFHPETIRFFILSSHYRSQVNFSDAALKEAHSGLTRVYQALKAAEAVLDTPVNTQSEATVDIASIDSEIRGYSANFIKAMNDDFNTPQAISVLFSLAKEVNKLARETEDDQAIAKLKAAVVTLKGLAGTLNIGQVKPTEFLQAQIGAVDEGQMTDEQIDTLIQERIDAKANKNFARADEIRNLLQQNNIELEDSKQGTTWRRI
ncbi:cysteine--tRNA ligase [Psychrobacter sanguinis]|uniref:cysteine--tRNA ligase n=1 Tax=Psychrobacter sanguinis TaxID=861445 RepID=UPI00191A1CAF|nr:cysteine--tRNA ligase [Psychrobacter sanguinis]MCC3307683.1 cysteine--tRNA ligase [Psychrobacter sanguinis]UEC25003.1 cysteine--tRNA ligase [Psychrobacter sanguinis]